MMCGLQDSLSREPECPRGQFDGSAGSKPKAVRRDL